MEKDAVVSNVKKKEIKKKLQETGLFFVSCAFQNGIRVAFSFFFFFFSLVIYSIFQMTLFLLSSTREMVFALVLHANVLLFYNMHVHSRV